MKIFNLFFISKCEVTVKKKINRIKISTYICIYIYKHKNNFKTNSLRNILKYKLQEILNICFF